MGTERRLGWRHIERYVYLQRPYEDVWGWLAGHLSTLGEPLPGGGRSVELRIRPRGREIARPVRLEVAGVVAGDDRTRASISWTDVTHPNLFPRLEATLEVMPVPDGAARFTQLGVQADYRPPLAVVGELGDRLVGGQVTDAALTTFLDELADAATDQIAPPSRGGGTDRETTHPAGEEAAIRRLLVTVDGLGVRPGGAVGVTRALAAVPGVLHVSVDPWTGLAAVDHDPARCGLDEVAAALEEQAASPPDC
jgi:hypothetical protein